MEQQSSVMAGRFARDERERGPAAFFARQAGALIQEMVAQAGIVIGRDLIVHDPRLWADWAGGGLLAIGESYMEGRWDAPRLDQVMAKLAALPGEAKRKLFSSNGAKAALWLNAALNPQRRAKEIEVAEAHYNLGNEFFRAWLDPSMQYSCGCWARAQTLEEAQLAKMRLIAAKLKLRPGMRVLDIGCGWGGLGRFLIREHGVRVTGVNISREQMAWCRQKAREEDVQDSFEALEVSYRDLKGTWDRIVIVGMLEHVGPKNYAAFFDLCRRCLADGGLLLLQTIGSNQSADSLNDRWITRYIFPNGTLPSLAQLGRAVEKKLVIEDVQNLGPDYDRTLMAWHQNFQAAKARLNLSAVFERMWDFYLLYTASGFRERKTQLWQVVMSKGWKPRCDMPRETPSA